MNTKILFTFLAIAASATMLRAQAPARQSDPIVGEWRWINNVVVKITADGRCTCPTMNGTWEFTNNKETERKYALKWDKDLLVDSLTLSRDGKRLSGRSNAGVSVSAEKIDRPAPTASAPPATPAAPVASAAAALPLAGGRQPSLKGSFHVSVDDSATIYVNGAKFYSAPLNQSHSPEMELKATDRVVVHLHNATAGRRFMMVFVSTDQANLINFRSKDYKMVTDPDVTDFKPEQLARWYKQPKSWEGRSLIPVKSYSDWVWGEGDDSILACIVTPQMFSQKPK